eukprot:TRINITY_DN3770_c0_g1_i1.p3 TRINITY_DN3770_c0_g1~~TRINITY_DN3770_c0_g1_i1.p3  ORF type:complete len:125 (-),score=3.07 TRINITY_DN3770_c0_g1_i1:81-455(-)
MPMGVPLISNRQKFPTQISVLVNIGNSETEKSVISKEISVTNLSKILVSAHPYKYLFPTKTEVNITSLNIIYNYHKFEQKKQRQNECSSLSQGYKKYEKNFGNDKNSTNRNPENNTWGTVLNIF